MQVIRGADVDDVDVVGLDEILRGRVGAFCSQRRRSQQAAFRRRSGDAYKASTRQPCGTSVDSTYEPRPRNGDANLSSRHESGR